MIRDSTLYNVHYGSLFQNSTDTDSIIGDGPATYWSIVATNVPRPDLSNQPPDPQSSALNLTVIEAISKTKNKVRKCIAIKIAVAAVYV